VKNVLTVTSLLYMAALHFLQLLQGSVLNGFYGVTLYLKNCWLA